MEHEGTKIAKVHEEHILIFVRLRDLRVFVVNVGEPI